MLTADAQVDTVLVFQRTVHAEIQLRGTAVAAVHQGERPVARIRKTDAPYLKISHVVQKNGHVAEHGGVLAGIIAQKLLAHAVGLAPVQQGLAHADDADAALLTLCGISQGSPGVFIAEDILYHTVRQAQMRALQHDAQVGGEQDRTLDDPKGGTGARIFARDDQRFCMAFLRMIHGILYGLAVACAKKARIACKNSHSSLPLYCSEEKKYPLTS